MQEPSSNNIRVLIVGAGKAGDLVREGLQSIKNSAFEIVGFIDDDLDKIDSKLGGLPIIGPIASLREIITENGIQEVFIAIPSERGTAIRRVIESCYGCKVSFKILPRQSEVLIQSFKEDFLKYVRKVRPEDLLGGEIHKSDQGEITKFSKDQVILITGAAGSIGSELSRQIAAHGAKNIIFYDWWENGMFELRNQLVELYPAGKYEFIIGDIKDKKRVNSLMSQYRPDTVFHAAAYKHVPLMEHNPSEAIKNNIIGTKTLGDAAVKYKVKKFILVSSDKAVNPTNIMGATKRAAEKNIHILAESQSDTIFCAVRFGNVINSNGSAIPIFEKQINKGGPVTVTHKDITRYFMTIPEAVHLILQSWVMGKNNDLFVLDMGEPIKIYELAKLLIGLNGYEPEKDIKIEITGLRPGEKLYEEVLVKEEETMSTSVKKIFRTKNYMSFDKLKFLNNQGQLIDMLDEETLDVGSLKRKLGEMISTYTPSKH